MNHVIEIENLVKRYNHEILALDDDPAHYFGCSDLR